MEGSRISVFALIRRNTRNVTATNFTREIKREIVRRGIENACCGAAALSAFLRVTGSVLRSGLCVGFEFVTESERTAEFIIGMLEDLFGAELKVVRAETDKRRGGDRLVFQCLSEHSLYILQELGIVECVNDAIRLNMDIDRYMIENDCCKRAYIIGAFLGSGSCTLPRLEDTRSGYHLEIVFSGQKTADSFLQLLADYEILAKYVERKGTYVVYLKNLGAISDFLHLIGAETALQKLDALASEKEERNHINRVANCLQKNYDKSVLASVQQIRAIEMIAEKVGLQELDEPLCEVAQARMADKEASLKELAERLGITKSCLNHRLRKLVRMAEDLSGEE